MSINVRAFLNPTVIKILTKLDMYDEAAQIKRFLVAGFIFDITLDENGCSVDVGHITPHLNLVPELRPYIIGFSISGSEMLTLTRPKGEYTDGCAWVGLRQNSNTSGALYSIVGEIKGPAESYKILYKHLIAVLGGQKWPDPGKDFGTEQCHKPILQMKYHLREAMRIIRDRIVAWCRRIFRR